MPTEDYNTGQELKKLFEDFTEFLELKYDLLRLDISERFVKFFSGYFSFFILIVLIPFSLFFLSFAGAYYMSEVLGSLFYGFVSVGLIYFVVIILFLIFRNVLINRPLVKFIINSLFKNK